MGEYRAQAQGVPYSRSRFCERWVEFRQRLRRSMRQIHVTGEKLFVDYAGMLLGIPIIVIVKVVSQHVEQ
ncbi:MAG: hypothetical protein ABI349_13345 [Casimicrobiaceae bacterium]